MRFFMLFSCVLMLGGCVSASTSNKICADLGIVNKVVGAVNEQAGQALVEWTPKKCVGVGVTGDIGKLIGGVSASVSNE